MRLELRSPAGEDLSPLFRRVAIEEGFRPARVVEIDTPRGIRYPAFLIAEGTAFFGWLFEERFSEKRARRIFASVEREKETIQQDWRFILGPGSKEEILVAIEQPERFDPERPDLW